MEASVGLGKYTAKENLIIETPKLLEQGKDPSPVLILFLKCCFCINIKIALTK